MKNSYIFEYLDENDFRKSVDKNNKYVMEATKSDLAIEKYKGMLNK